MSLGTAKMKETKRATNSHQAATEAPTGTSGLGDMALTSPRESSESRRWTGRKGTRPIKHDGSRDNIPKIEGSALSQPMLKPLGKASIQSAPAQQELWTIHCLACGDLMNDNLTLPSLDPPRLTMSTQPILAPHSTT